MALDFGSLVKMLSLNIDLPIPGPFAPGIYFGMKDIDPSRADDIIVNQKAYDEAEAAETRRIVLQGAAIAACALAAFWALSRMQKKVKVTKGYRRR